MKKEKTAVPNRILKRAEAIVKKDIERYLEENGLKPYISKARAKTDVFWAKQMSTYRKLVEKALTDGDSILLKQASKCRPWDQRINLSYLTPEEAFAHGVNFGNGMARDAIYGFHTEIQKRKSPRAA